MQVHDPSPFHPGERAIQDALGVDASFQTWARKVVRTYLPAAHREFYEGLPFLVISSRDAAGRPWAAILDGEPGFIRSPDDQTLLINADLAEGDALAGALRGASKVGVPEAVTHVGGLGIEFATGRRNRINGVLARKSVHASPDEVVTPNPISTPVPMPLEISVRQSFGNCSQYIHERAWHRVPKREPGVGSTIRTEAGRTTHSDRLTTSNAAVIRAADTFFIATGIRGGQANGGAPTDGGEHESVGMDVSHRGGPRGFVHIENDRTLLFPDYSGNNHFNTFGNLLVDPRAGLLFLDFAEGTAVQLSGEATVEWDHPDVVSFTGARRLVRFDIHEVVENVNALGIRWTEPAEAPRALRVRSKRRESEAVVSFELEAADDQPLAPFRGGQYLPIEIDLPNQHAPVTRTYSLSGADAADHYRISVKRMPGGMVSSFLHDQIEVGATLSARPPRGEFTVDAADRPILLVSAGIGITPMLAMLHELAGSNDVRRVTFVHGARDGTQLVFADEVKRLVAASDRFSSHVAFSQPRTDDVQGTDYDSAGRIDAALLASLEPDSDADIYLCGPGAFMAALEQDLKARGVPEARIHSESFGPSASRAKPGTRELSS